MTSGVASIEVSARSSPHFAGGGPDADEYGATKGYPIGSTSTFDQIPFLVGSYSHFDRIFEGRLIRRAAAPSRLERASIEPAIRYEFEGRSLTLDDYLARNPVTDSWSHAKTPYLWSGINTHGTNGIASRRGRWRRRSPRC